MRKIVLAINTTPDGFCDHRAVLADDELHEFYSGLLDNADTMLFGRKTFQLMDPYSPEIARNKTGSKAEVAFAERFEAINKFVFSKSGIQTDWKNTTILRDLDKTQLLQMKAQPGKDILVGSPGIVDQLSKLGLIDEFYYLVQPMIPGNGKRFFESEKLGSPIRLRLLETSTLSSGVVVMRYRKAD